MKVYPVSFDDTEHAFAHKSDSALKKARWLFAAMSLPWLVNAATSILPWAVRSGLPVRGLVRRTLFEQFAGGETLESTAIPAGHLQAFGVQVILDYGAEGKMDEESFGRACEEFIRVVKYAGSQSNIPFISIKLTGLARFSLLEKLDQASGVAGGYAARLLTEVLDNEERAEWDRVVSRMDRIVAAAAETKVGVMVDAEESWIQSPVDVVTLQLMEKYNRHRPVVYNTVQLYRTDRLLFLRQICEIAQQKKFIAAVKLVRGAYLEKERERAAALGYPSPVHADKLSCDRDYNEALEYAISHIGHVAAVVATHNESSTLLALRLMERYGLDRAHRHLHFSQLYGMSDHITFNLALAGYPVSKYLPYGPLREVIPYLMRRAQENTSVAGQTGRELQLIKKEIRRRRQAGKR